MKIPFEILENKDVVLGVSGGVDSMVMLHLFCTQYGGKFEVVTVNHNLRKESFSDCELVKRYCEDNGINCQIVSVDVENFCKENKLSTETGARILRHQALAEVAQGRVICLAHNSNDQAETVLLHILRGSGADGGCGMNIYDGTYFRPLLGVLRGEIEQYANCNGVPFATDCTNSQSLYKRNFLRNNVFPNLAQINSSAVSNICKFADFLRADKDIFDGILEVVFTKYPPKYDSGTATFSTQICTLSSSIASRAVFRIFDKLGYEYDIEQVHINDILALADKNVGKQVSLPFNLVAVKDYNSITICPNMGALSYVDSVAFGVGNCVVAEQEITVSKDGKGLQFDLDKVPSTAVFRTRREGDVFTKFGGGTKKLKDYLIDKKIPQKQRDSLVLVAEENVVLIIVGVEISEQVRCDNNSNVYRISASKE